MLSLTYRSLKLYFCSRSNVLLSMLGALIAFVLYLVFIKQAMVDQWQNMPAKLALLDNWLIGGVLSATAITTTFSSLKQFVLDRESQVIKDLILTDVSYFKIQMSYVCASAIVGLLMQMMMAIIMMNYFVISDQVAFDLALLPQLIIIMLLATILSTAINLLILQFVKKVSTVALLSTIIGTASGFLVGTYMPLGALPSFAQWLVKLTPGSYVAALYRQLLMSDLLQNNLGNQLDLRHEVEFNLGVKYDLFGSQLSTWQDWVILLSVIVLAMALIAVVSSWQKREQR
ncbi:ABC transporter permease [Holzapfeliella sp. He02]|uniref:ABC transporter permease n=1 Tax=Holzapfeliella saturejae TaxID=3082953 RepID=A0ABU8SF36_9LACO